MICNHCEEEIYGDAICLDCLEIALLENSGPPIIQPKKTPVELAAGDLLEAAEWALEYLLANPDAYSKPRANTLRKAIAKAQGNPSLQPNPAEQDEHKSAE